MSTCHRALFRCLAAAVAVHRPLQPPITCAARRTGPPGAAACKKVTLTRRVLHAAAALPGGGRNNLSDRDPVRGEVVRMCGQNAGLLRKFRRGSGVREGNRGLLLKMAMLSGKAGNS